jgi:hypothetical protein
MQKFLTPDFYDQLHAALLQELQREEPTASFPLSKISDDDPFDRLMHIDNTSMRPPRREPSDISILSSSTYRRPRSLSADSSARSYSITTPQTLSRTGTDVPLFNIDPFRQRSQIGRPPSLSNTAMVNALSSMDAYLEAIFSKSYSGLYARLPKSQRRHCSRMPDIILFPSLISYVMTMPPFYGRPFRYPMTFYAWLITPAPHIPSGSVLSPAQYIIFINSMSIYSEAAPIMTKSRRLRLMHSIFLFDIYGIFCALVISVELALQWNVVRGVQKINSVGQLVPFILGAGGLSKVLWTGWAKSRGGKPKAVKAEIVRSDKKSERALEEIAQLWARVKELRKTKTKDMAADV